MTEESIRHIRRMMRLGLTDGSIEEIATVTAMDVYIAKWFAPHLRNGGNSRDRRCNRRSIARLNRLAGLPSAYAIKRAATGRMP